MQHHFHAYLYLQSVHRINTVYFIIVNYLAYNTCFLFEAKLNAFQCKAKIK